MPWKMWEALVENPDLYKRMTGRQNLEYFASMYKDVNKDHIDEVVRLVKMSERIDDRVKTYSLGMCQRVGIAQALLHRPRLLVLDEPTNGLDPLWDQGTEGSAQVPCQGSRHGCVCIKPSFV
jgi:ABC-2 type transport system ATP-binding protein